VRLMLRGLYTAGWGMLGRMKSMDVISNNLANINTTGYKQDVAVFESFPDVLVGRINDRRGNFSPTRYVGDVSLGSDIGEVFTNHMAGMLTRTDRSLDLSIEGEPGAFFTMGAENEQGEMLEYFTRNGAFALNGEGNLVDYEGRFVLGENGVINIESEIFFVQPNGTVLVEGEVVDRIRITQFENPRDLVKLGNNLMGVNPEIEEAPQINFEGTIRQGYIEASNVNTIKEMVSMIEVLRVYEANQKVVQTVDEILQKAVNEVGSIR
jgi:flagellar basal-body rod protein FlgF